MLPQENQAVSSLVHVQVMPLLRPFLGPGRPFNFLIRNKWRSGQQMHKLRQLPVLLLSSLRVSHCPHQGASRQQGLCNLKCFTTFVGSRCLKYCTCPCAGSPAGLPLDQIGTCRPCAGNQWQHVPPCRMRCCRLSRCGNCTIPSPAVAMQHGQSFPRQATWMHMRQNRW